MKNEMNLQFSALSENESFARVAIAAFMMTLDPSLDELTEIKTVVSEAVTNSIIHGYEMEKGGIVYLSASIDSETGKLEIEVRDEGCGIMDLEEARQPLFTSKPELERSGMGFTIIENFMDEMVVESHPGIGTSIRVTKFFSKNNMMVH